MKNLKSIYLITLFISASSLISYASLNNSTNIEANHQIENTTCNYGQCTATAKSTGQRCKHCVSNAGDLKCYQHK